MKGTSSSRGCGEVVASGIKSAMMEIVVFIKTKEGEVMSIITIGIDLAKNIFAVHGVNENGHAELVKLKVARDQLSPLIATCPRADRLAPAPERTTGHAYSNSRATPSN